MKTEQRRKKIIFTVYLKRLAKREISYELCVKLNNLLMTFVVSHLGDCFNPSVPGEGLFWFVE